MSAAREPGLIVLGVVTRPHGVRGEVRVHRFNPTSTLLLELERVIVRRKDGSERPLAIRAAKRSGDVDVLWLEGCARPEDAEALRGAELAVPREALPAPAEDEHYHVDLVGMRVREGERELGEVIEVVSHPSVDALRVRTDRGTIELPILAPYVVSIDREARAIEVACSEDFEPEAP